MAQAMAGILSPAVQDLWQTVSHLRLIRFAHRKVLRLPQSPHQNVPAFAVPSRPSRKCLSHASDSASGHAPVPSGFSLPYGADEPLPFAYLTPARAFLSHPKNDPMPEIPGFRVQSLIPVHFAQKTASHPVHYNYKMHYTKTLDLSPHVSSALPLHNCLSDCICLFL